MALWIGAAASAAWACGADEPALTMTFAGLPSGPGVIEVRLFAEGQRFGGAAAGDGGVTVTYEGDGSIRVVVDRAAGPRLADRVRLPLRAPRALVLRGRAEASVAAGHYRDDDETDVRPGQHATLAFAFLLVDGGADTGADQSAAVDAGTDTGADQSAVVDGGADTGADQSAVVDAGADAPDTSVGADAPAGTDGGADRPPPGDGGDDAIDGRPGDLGPAEVAPDAPPSDAGSDGVTIPPGCTVALPRPASVSLVAGGGTPTVAAAAGLYGVAWAGPSGDGVLYNALDGAGALQSATADVAVVPPGGGFTVGRPRLARAGADLVLAFGRRAASGRSETAVARISPATGQLRAGPVTGTTITDARPPEIGEVAASADGTRIALVSRRDALDTPAQVAVDLFGDPLAQVAAGLPAPLEEIRTATGIAWVAGRAEFVVGAVSESTGVGGRLVAFSDSSLAPGTGLLFTSAAAAPAVGSAAGVSVAGVGDRVAVAWTDWRTCSGCSGREIFLTIVDASGGRPFGEVQVSEPSTTPKSFPKVVFDGAALAVAWLEYQDPDRSDVKLRRFDDRLGPAGPILGVGPVGQPRPASGDIDLAAAAPGDYAVVMSIQTGRQSLTRVTCAGTGN